MQEPQCAGSFVRSAQIPLQFVLPAGHAQVPAAQLMPPVQAMPQPPQLVLLVLVSTHAPLQFVRPAPQEDIQRPAEQTCPVAHVVVHEPQCEVSFVVS